MVEPPIVNGYSSAAIWPRAGHRNGDDQAALAAHRVAILVPVGMLAGYPAVVIDEQVHRLGQVDEIRGALGLDPLAEEPVRHDADRGARITREVLHLHR